MAGPQEKWPGVLCAHGSSPLARKTLSMARRIHQYSRPKSGRDKTITAVVDTRRSPSCIGNNSTRPRVANSVGERYWFATNRLTPVARPRHAPAPLPTLAPPRATPHPCSVPAGSEVWPGYDLFQRIAAPALSQLVCINVPPSERRRDPHRKKQWRIQAKTF